MQRAIAAQHEDLTSRNLSGGEADFEPSSSVCFSWARMGRIRVGVVGAVETLQHQGGACAVDQTPADDAPPKRKRNGNANPRRRRRQPRAARAAQSLQKTIAEQQAAAVQQTVADGASERKLQEVTTNKEESDGTPRT